MRYWGLLGVCLCLAGGVAAKELRLPALDWEQRSDWVNVREAGALGDGRADDTAALQKTLDAVTDGTTIYLPPGRYRITKTLTIRGPLLGVLIVGHGRDTELLWDGAAGGAMLLEDGVAYSRYVGISFRGEGKAGIGLLHEDNRRFTTEVRHQHLAFYDFTEAGIKAEPNDKFALAETSFENCLFVRCVRGVEFTKFNDYDYTFDGCEFVACGTGIHCKSGNFYIRNCHFTGSTTVDIYARPEHGSSIRRCTSVGSQAFVDHSSGVSPLTIQDCHVAGWLDPEGAIRLRGAPVIMFDCVFTDPPSRNPPVDITDKQKMIISQNKAAKGKLLSSKDASIYEVPAGKRQGSVRSAQQSFFSETERVPGKVFDAKRDFGAKGDGRTDDTAALQATIDAAREHGEEALAYLPAGVYAISDTLQITGKSYRVGGSGSKTGLLWKGSADGTMIEVRQPNRITLEHLNVGSHDVGEMTNAIDIHQIGSGGRSLMTYDGVTVYGKYQRQPLAKGFRFTSLGPKEYVRIPDTQGNMRFTDCAAATILVNCSYEGSITVEGSSTERDGLLGFQTRLATLVAYGLLLRDNHSIVMSDFYIEQADNGYAFQGNRDLPPGRATIQGAKTHFILNEERATGSAIAIDDYHGEIFMGHNQFYVEPKNMRMTQTGNARVNLYLVGLSFYDSKPDMEMGDRAKVYVVGSNAVGMKTVTYDAADALPDSGLSRLVPMLDDLRRLGATDLAFNHPGH